MRYWWVNQNQTFKHETQGGYLWSSKRNANGAPNPFYENMREVAPGDLVLSFYDTRIVAIGIAQSYCWESPKPSEFGTAGQNWEDVGWRVRVGFTLLANKIRPKDHIELLRPLLPEKYSPLQANGNGLQSVYLAEVPEDVARVILGLIGTEIETITDRPSDLILPSDDIDTWEKKIETVVQNDPAIPETDRLAIVRAGPIQRTCGHHREEMPHHRRREPCPSRGQSLQAVA